MKPDIQSSRKRFELLDFARGIAAFGILLFHAYPKPIFSTLYTFVDFFFVLSGFVLAPSYMRVNSLKQAINFLIDRAFRLFPMVFATLFFVVGFQLVVDIKHYLFGEMNESRIDTSLFTLVAGFGLLQIFSNTATLLNFPLWSLSAEWVCSFLVLARPISKKGTLFLSLIIGGLLILVSQFTNIGWQEQLGRACFGFFLGIILREFCTRQNKVSFWGLTITFALVFILNLATYHYSSKLSYLSPFVYGFAVIQLSYIRINDESKLAKFSDFFGRYSYGFYAWHFPMLSLAGIVTQEGMRIIPLRFYGSEHLQVVLCVFLTLTLTYLTLKYLETPLRLYRAQRIKLK